MTAGQIARIFLRYLQNYNIKSSIFVSFVTLGLKMNKYVFKKMVMSEIRK